MNKLLIATKNLINFRKNLKRNEVVLHNKTNPVVWNKEKNKIEIIGNFEIEVDGNLKLKSNKHLILESGRNPSDHDRNIPNGIWLNTRLDQNGNPILNNKKPKMDFLKQKRKLKKANKKVTKKCLKH